MLPVPWLLTCSVGPTCHYLRPSFGAGGAPCQWTGCWTSLMTFPIRYVSSHFMISSPRSTLSVQLLTAPPRAEPEKFRVSLRTAARVQRLCALSNIRMDCPHYKDATFSGSAQTTKPVSLSLRRFDCSPSEAEGRYTREPLAQPTLVGVHRVLYDGHRMLEGQTL